VTKLRDILTYVARTRTWELVTKLRDRVKLPSKKSWIILIYDSL